MKKIYFFLLINAKIKNNKLLIILSNINNDKFFVSLEIYIIFIFNFFLLFSTFILFILFF